MRMIGIGISYPHIYTCQTCAKSFSELSNYCPLPVKVVKVDLYEHIHLFYGLLQSNRTKKLSRLHASLPQK